MGHKKLILIVKGDDVAVRILGINNLDHPQNLAGIGSQRYAEHGFRSITGDLIEAGIITVGCAFRNIVNIRNIHQISSGRYISGYGLLINGNTEY
ncbi:hypothetical protein ES703_121165 [subsurface metagenome]